MRRRPTIKDVAQRAGVSTATVSFVLNDRAGQAISLQVKKRVLAAAEALQYHPSANAAGLARRRTRNVAVVFYQKEQLIANQFYSYVIQGAIKEAMQREYNLLFSYVSREYRDHTDLPKVVREGNAEGIIFVQRLSPAMVADIQSRGVPVVAIDHYPVTPGIGSLQLDNRRGGALAAEHLLELGHQRIAMVLGAETRPSIMERAEGFFSALASRGLELPRKTAGVHSKNFSFHGGYQAALSALSKRNRPTALFCANDEMAAGVLRAAREAGVRVPDQLSVVGFDDIAMSDYTDPPLTTIGGNKERLGSRAVARLLDLVERKSAPEFREDVGVDLVLRRSTAPPTKG